MTQHINVHLPPGVTDLNELRLQDFISQTNTDGGVKTTDLYYHPAAPKTLKEKFLQNLGALSGRVSARWKPALKSENLQNALINIHGAQHIRTKADVANTFGSTIIRAAKNNGELSANGATITLKNADDAIEKHRLDDI